PSVPGLVHPSPSFFALGPPLLALGHLQLAALSALQAVRREEHVTQLKQESEAPAEHDPIGKPGPTGQLAIQEIEGNVDDQVREQRRHEPHEETRTLFGELARLVAAYQLIRANSL